MLVLHRNTAVSINEFYLGVRYRDIKKIIIGLCLTCGLYTPLWKPHPAFPTEGSEPLSGAGHGGPPIPSLPPAGMLACPQV